MATLDFTPLFRSSIGFDQLPGLLSHALQREETGYPPYNIEKIGEDQYRIVHGRSGFQQGRCRDRPGPEPAVRARASSRT